MAVNLTDKFERALQYATIIHGGQRRKHSDVPYMAHLLGVASIALEYGADETEAIAAVLHDAVEEAGGTDRLADILMRFGETVAEIVDGCTDTKAQPKPPWRARKAAYIAHLPHATASVRLVSAADKLYNARLLLKDLRLNGNGAWNQTKGGKEGTLWYLRCLVQAYKTAGINPLVEEFERAVVEIELMSKLLESEETQAMEGQSAEAGN